MKLKNLSTMIAVVLIATLFGFADLYGQDIIENNDTLFTVKQKVEWLGWVQFMDEYIGIDPGFYGGNPPPTQYYRKDIEIGLREDGIVVWRKTKANSK